MKHADKAQARLKARRDSYDLLSTEKQRGRKRPGSLKKPHSLKGR